MDGRRADEKGRTADDVTAIAAVAWPAFDDFEPAKAHDGDRLATAQGGSDGVTDCSNDLEPGDRAARLAERDAQQVVQVHGEQVPETSQVGVAVLVVMLGVPALTVLPSLMHGRSLANNC